MTLRHQRIRATRYSVVATLAHGPVRHQADRRRCRLSERQRAQAPAIPPGPKLGCPVPPRPRQGRGRDVRRVTPAVGTEEQMGRSGRDAHSGVSRPSGTPVRRPESPGRLRFVPRHSSTATKLSRSSSARSRHRARLREHRRSYRDCRPSVPQIAFASTYTFGGVVESRGPTVQSGRTSVCDVLSG